MSRKGKTAEFSLQSIISLILICSVLLISAILITQSYVSQRALLLTASQETALNLADNLDTQMLKLVNPLDTTLRLLSHDDALTRGAPLDEQRQGLDMMVEALDANPILSSVYAGYDNGSFLLVRTLRNKTVHRALQAPQNAVFLVQSVERDDAGNWLAGHWLYYDRDLVLLESEERADYRFDPRNRPWYTSAIERSDYETALTEPYVFYTTLELGVTMSRMDADSGTVIGIDASVNDLSVYLEQLKSRLLPQSQLAVVNSSGRVLAYPDVNELIQGSAETGFKLTSIDQLSAPVLRQLHAANKPGEIRAVTDNGETWYGVSAPMVSFMEDDLQLLLALPASQLLSSAQQSVAEQIFWSVIITLVLLLVVVISSRKILKPFAQLSSEVMSLASFDFRKKIKTRSHITELNNLCRVLSQMAGTISHFQQISSTLAREKDLDKMLSETLYHMKESTSAQGVAIYLYESDDNGLMLASHIDLRPAPEFIPCPEGSAKSQRSTLKRAFATAVDAAAGDENTDTVLLTSALLDRESICVGVLVMQMAADSGEITGTSLKKNMQLRRSYSHFIHEMSGSAATAIETRRQIEIQRNLLDAIIQLLADAIDAKSPYTMGHCERVPELAEMLIDEAQRVDTGELGSFSLSETERYEFKIAAWMHDCGKITSPEYIVDKATKLETISNRIHEVRTRFEVLWRDAEISYLNGVLDGGDKDSLKQHKERTQQQLQEEFAEVAQANIGGEFMSDEAIARLEHIAQRQWLRHFDKRLGLSRDELQRLPQKEDEPLPATEYLLADRPDHLLAWDDARKPPVEKGDPRNTWGFDMVLPQHSLNLGELHNLSIKKGTLTAEDRFKINDHIVQTICMLSRLPLPAYLKRVPDIAGNHHEKMDGTGYPRKLHGDDLSIAEKVMAIADIFEALTAADRPYKEAKTLEESLRIMAFMAKDRHIDMPLFRLFVEREVYAAYATRFMQPKQITAIDKEQILALAEGQ